MKKYLVLLTALLAFTFVSCTKNKESVEKTDGDVVYTEDSVLEEVTVTADPEIPCVLFYETGYLWTLNNDGTLDADTQLTCGTEFLAYPATSDSKNEIVEAYEYSRTGKKSTEIYAHVFYQDKDYWINMDLIQPDSKAAIVIDPKAMIYNTADIVDVGSKSVPQFQLVAVLNGFEDDTFAKITFRAADKSSREVYVKKAAISNKSDDVLCYRVLTRALTLKDSVVVSELFDDCETLNLSNAMSEKMEEDFSDYIDALAAE